jgi:hypothetical protein
MADPRRLPFAAHYVIRRTEPAELGATKLNKILWFADLEYYRQNSRTITGLDAYVRMPRGPVPDGIEVALNELKAKGSIIERQSRVIDYYRREFISLREPNISMFSATEIDTLNVFIDIIRRQPAGFVSDVTHEDPFWKELDNGQMMPIGASSVISRTPSQSDLEWARQLA